MPPVLPKIGDFLRTEAGGGVLLMIAMAIALLVANYAIEPLYLTLLGKPGAVRLGAIEIDNEPLVRVGVPLGTALSGLSGFALLRTTTRG